MLRRRSEGSSDDEGGFSGGGSPAPVVRTRKRIAARATMMPSRPSHVRGGPDFEVARSCWKRMYLTADMAKLSPWES